MTAPPVGRELKLHERYTRTQAKRAEAVRCPTCDMGPGTPCVFLVNVQYRGQNMPPGSFHTERYPTHLPE